MKLQCQVEVVNRLLSMTPMRTRPNKFVKSTLALGKECKNENQYFILLFTAANKTGVKYRINQNINQMFTKFIDEGKSTIRFQDPAHDLVIRSEPIQLKNFIKLLTACLSGKNVDLSNMSNISVTSIDQAPTKMVIKDRSEIPSKGLPRTLQSLYMVGLKLSNFRREILQLCHLTVLDLRNNELEKIPVEFGKMPCIAELYLSGNQLGVPEKVDWKWLIGPQLSQTLKLLDLSSNSLKEIPNSIWMLTSLITLKLDNNMLRTLPVAMGKMKYLRYLSLVSNRLRYLPCSLMKVKLEYIDLSGNLFQETRNSIMDSPSPWQLYRGNLRTMAGKVILRHGIQYDYSTIPFNLVEFLDQSCFCICGEPVMKVNISMIRHLYPKTYFTTVVLDANVKSVCFECFFCSRICFSKMSRFVKRKH